MYRAADVSPSTQPADPPPVRLECELLSRGRCRSRPRHVGRRLQRCNSIASNLVYISVSSRGVDAGSPSIGPATADVVATLRSRISRHVISPGEKLREQALAEEFGVPRTRVREALGMLEQRGLVERIPNRGAIVKRLALDQVFELYDVREVLEGLCARLAAEAAPPQAWDELVSFFEVGMPRLVAEGNYEAYIEGLDNLRRAMLIAAANPILADMLDTIRDQTQVIIRRIIILPGRAEVGLAEHQAVLRALQSRDPYEAEALQRSNIRSAREYLRRFKGFVL